MANGASASFARKRDRAILYVHEDVATRLMFGQDPFAAVECQRPRASSAHGCRFQPALIQRCNQRREQAQLSRINMIALSQTR